ncbi:MAG: chemotaxis protein CheW [Verrucomicrobiaceae bacterium]|jgi:chemotaxis-related protein WspD|nr:chemotaxis protein CheW [Verrucomicrobiaceae bacterium]
MSADGLKQRCWAEKGLWGDCTCSQLGNVIHCRNCATYENAATQHLQTNVLPKLPAVRNSADEFKQSGKAYFIFKCANLYFALSPNYVGEITPISEVHRIPHRSGNAIEGISNINGELVLVIDIYSTFSLVKPETENGLMVLCKFGGENFAFKTESVLGVRKVDEAKIVEVADVSRRFVCESFSVNNLKNINVLDIELLTSAIINRRI